MSSLITRPQSTRLDLPCPHRAHVRSLPGLIYHVLIEPSLPGLIYRVVIEEVHRVPFVIDQFALSQYPQCFTVNMYMFLNMVTNIRK